MGENFQRSPIKKIHIKKEDPKYVDTWFYYDKLGHLVKKEESFMQKIYKKMENLRNNVNKSVRTYE